MVNDKSKDIIVKIINHMSTNNILGITYAESIDEDTVAQLNISVTNDIGGETLPSKRITLFNCTDDDKSLIKDVLTFLSEEETVGFTYDMEVPDIAQKLHINVILKQISTDDE